ncbi:Transmembrane 9 superfamily member 1 [Zea mays]|uniref:Transmembrane 9 superfamily member n=1 Tax=Zea mays TaxID=4577 RepID=A0A1D6MYS1_MAIZE|nr:Transmembrane 9 superfamily member 1 [Zea mays]
MLPSTVGGRGRYLMLGIALALAALLALASASESDHKYKTEEPVKLWVNKVGPYNNPQETYNYYSLPFCQPSENPTHKWGGLGEVLGGNELIDSQLEIKFLKNVEKGFICTLELDAKKVQQFADAIESSYWFEFFIDDLPLWGFVGETDKNSENKHYLYTHKNILVKYNDNRIIHVNLTQESPTLLEDGKKLEMTYSVKWVATDVSFARRFEVYLDYPFFEHQERDVNEESGWKLVHGDVFRPPQSLMFLSALVGIGTQLAALILLVIVLAIVGMLYIGYTQHTLFSVLLACTTYSLKYLSDQ